MSLAHLRTIAGEKIGKSNKIFTQTSLTYLFKAKIESKISTDEEFRRTVDVACTEEDILHSIGVKERIQEGLEELLNMDIIDPQGWRWLKTRLDSVIT